MQNDYKLPDLKKVKRLSILLGIICGVLAVVYWLFTHAYLEVTIKGDSTSKYSISILNQESQKKETIETSSKTIKKLVKKGNYEIIVKQGNKNSLSITSVGSFLSTTNIESNPKPEKKRTFVGNSPASCLHYGSSGLVTYSCNGPVNDLQLHIPANIELPTYVKKPGDLENGSVESIVATKHGNYLIVATSDQGESEQFSQSFSAYPINQSLEIGAGKELDSIETNNKHTYLAYKDGFIVFGEDGKALYYAVPDLEAVTIDLQKSKIKNAHPFAYHSRGDTLLAAYTNLSDEEQHDDSNDGISSKAGARTIKANVEIIIQKGSETQRLNFKKQYSNALLCGDTKLCLVDGKLLEIYDISNGQQKHLFNISNVDKPFVNASGIAVLRNNDLLAVDVEKQSAEILYSFADLYENCGIGPAGEGYVLCLINNMDDKVAVYIDPKQLNIDNIDKKILQLREFDKVKNVSIYGRFIHFTPDLGSREYIPAIKGYGYDPKTKQSVTDAIQKEVDEIGISRTEYTVRSIYD